LGDFTTTRITGAATRLVQATVLETGEIVAIKKVLQDKRFKNRELQARRACLILLRWCSGCRRRHGGQPM
jgi:hypothetical protein